nr:uncharacterized protein LOC119169387 [Rhipicephalus microplus]
MTCSTQSGSPSRMSKTGRCAGQYSHPESPRPGSSWNGKVVSFDQVKLFSDEGYGQQPRPPVTLKIDSTYRVQVNVGAVNDSGHILSSTVFRKFIGHSFIAVSHACRNVPSLSQVLAHSRKKKVR